MAYPTNPNVPARSDQEHWTGPIGNGTVLTPPVTLPEVVFSNLPTADPGVAGQIYVDATTFALTVSQG